MPTTDLTPGTITTLGALRPGDVGVFVHHKGDDKPFVVGRSLDRDVEILRPTQAFFVWGGYEIRYLGRGRIEPPRIVMEGEPDRIRELEAGLTWTDAKPTVPGWYWFRTDADCEPTVSYYDPKNWFGREWMAHQT